MKPFEDRVLRISKAQRLTPADREVPSLAILIEDELGAEHPAWVFDEEAEALAGALQRVLPQGTWSRLVAQMAWRWAQQQQGVVSNARYWNDDEVVPGTVVRIDPNGPPDTAA